MAPVSLYPAASSFIRFAGEAVTVMYGPVLGGLIVNPSTAADQRIPEVEPIYVDVVGTAGLVETATTVCLQAGQSFRVPAGLTTNVSVNAATKGHKFTAVVFQTATPYPPSPQPSPFPPAGPTSLTKTIPSYLYQEYSDDEDLQAFVASYNALAQEYVSWFNDVNLPVYTGPLVVDSLLDWVAAGLYGITRPALASGRNKNLGPFNTYAFNSLTFNGQKVIGPQNVSATSDDVFKRIMTWNFYKGDGYIFNVRWLKRRIMRFLFGQNGTDVKVDQTYQVSVSFGLLGQINIVLLNSARYASGGATFDGSAFNTTTFNGIKTNFVKLPVLPNTADFQAALNSGVLQLPFQYTYVVVVR